MDFKSSEILIFIVPAIFIFAFAAAIYTVGDGYIITLIKLMKPWHFPAVIAVGGVIISTVLHRSING